MNKFSGCILQSNKLKIIKVFQGQGKFFSKSFLVGVRAKPLYNKIIYKKRAERLFF